MIVKGKDTVAILMSTYNGEKFLKKQINSLLMQTFTDFNLYIRDDGSTDKTLSIIDEASRTDNRIFVYKESNLGVKASFLLLLNRVQADYYFFCDQDDIWKNDKIEKTLKIADKEEPMLIHGNMELIDDDDEILTKKLKKDNLYTDFYNIMKKNNVTGCTMMINRALKDKCYLLDDKRIVMHDWWLGLYASYYGKVLYVNDPLMAYRKHSGNVMGTEYKLFNKVMKLLPAEIKTMRLSKEQLQLFRKIEKIKDNEIELYLEEYNSIMKRIQKSLLISKQADKRSNRVLSFIVNLF